MSSDLSSFLRWYLAITACGVLALPLTFYFFRRLPDRGYTLARAVGLIAIGYVFWLLSSLGLLRNEAGSLLLCGLAVAGLGLWRLRREGLDELRAWVREQARYVLAVEVLFFVALAVGAWVRAYNPDIVSTEKPMEFMFINSILQSPTFPPHDAWLSGHAISYYYFGYVLIAALTRVTSVDSAVAFNLGLAMLFALAIVGSFGVTLNLIALTKQQERPATYRLLPFALPALLAPLLIVIAGNFYGVLAVARANGWGEGWQVPVVRYHYGTGDPVNTPEPNEPPPAALDTEPGLRFGVISFWDWVDVKGLPASANPPPTTFNADPGYWWWFAGARVLQDRTLTGNSSDVQPIDEMPIFSFILGDMHPHVLALPFVILAVAVALEWLLFALAEGQHCPLDFKTLAQHPFGFIPFDHGLITGLLLGSLGFLNTWDFPMYWFLWAATFVAGLGLNLGWERLLKRWQSIGLIVVALAVGSVALYLPFYLTLQTQAGGILPNLIYPTRFQQIIVFFGPVWVGATLWMAWLTRKGRMLVDWEATLWAGGGLVVLLALGLVALTLGATQNPELMGYVDQAIAPLTRDQAWGLLIQRRVLDGLTTLFPAAFIGLAVGFVVGAIRRVIPENVPAAEQPPLEPGIKRRSRPLYAPAPAVDFRSPALVLSLTLIVTGALLLVGPEFVYLRDNFGVRMNTIFKFYFQVWVMWGLAAAFGAWYLFEHSGPKFKWGGAGVMAVAVALGLVYTVSGVYSKADHFKAEQPTLNGMAYFQNSYPDDWKAIEWLRDHVSGDVVVAEGTKGAYWIEGRSSRIAMSTGLPTVIGWVNHEGQWRGKYFAQVGDREGDLRTLYQTRDWVAAKAILDKYAVDYVVLSNQEREWYKPVFQPKFENGLTKVFEAGDVVIYRYARIK